MTCPLTRSVAGRGSRLFALVNVSIHDGVQTTQTSNFVYGLASGHGYSQRRGRSQRQTDADPTWLALITSQRIRHMEATRPVAGATAATALKRAFGTDDIPMAATWTQSDGGDITHHFAGFWEAAEEQAKSRIYGGIHYRFDPEASQQWQDASSCSPTTCGPRRWDD